MRVNGHNFRAWTIDKRRHRAFVGLPAAVSGRIKSVAVTFTGNAYFAASSATLRRP